MLDAIKKLKGDVDLKELASILGKAKFNYAIKTLEDDNISGSPKEVVEQLYFLDRTQEFFNELSACIE